MYAAIIAKRVAAWATRTDTVSPSLKGFLPFEGCLEHGFTLRSILHNARRRKRPVCATWLDLKDAYSSVPHATLLRVLELAGLDGWTLDAIKDIYSGSTTRVKTKQAITAPITCNRGIKQGCPLSPILFNLVMEAIIRAVEKVPDSGYTLANTCIRSLAYAEDLCLLATSRTVTQKMLDQALQASQWAGLTFNAWKCACLTILRGTRPRQRAVPFEPTLGGEKVPALAWDQSYKYLGCKMGADPKVELSKIGEEFAGPSCNPISPTGRR